MYRIGLAIVITFLLSCLSATAGEHILRFATTTTIKASGLSEQLVQQFENDTGYKVKLYIEGTGHVLRRGRVGDVDVILTHAPAEEEKFVAEGFGLKRYPIMYNDFILVGPAIDPARIKQNTSISDAFSQIAKTQILFVSRGDDSGTHKKERQVWRDTNIDPYGNDWYFEIGTGMKETLEYCNQEKAYTLTDRGTWLAMKDELSLVVVLEGDQSLRNYYAIITINPNNANKVNVEASQTFLAWLFSEKGQNLIANYSINNTPLFTLVSPDK